MNKKPVKKKCFRRYVYVYRIMKSKKEKKISALTLLALFTNHFAVLKDKLLRSVFLNIFVKRLDACAAR